MSQSINTSCWDNVRVSFELLSPGAFPSVAYSRFWVILFFYTIYYCTLTKIDSWYPGRDLHRVGWAAQKLSHFGWKTLDCKASETYFHPPSQKNKTVHRWSISESMKDPPSGQTRQILSNISIHYNVIFLCFIICPKNISPFKKGRYTIK